jgi:hypothetical protein
MCVQVRERVDVLLCDLASALLPALEGAVDLLVSWRCSSRRFGAAGLPPPLPAARCGRLAGGGDCCGWL